MEELVDLPWMAPILGICRLEPSTPLSDLHQFKKLYLTAKVPGMGKIFSELFALALGRVGLEPPRKALPWSLLECCKIQVRHTVQ